MVGQNVRSSVTEPSTDQNRMNRRKADFKFLYKYLEDDL